jgi:hypothetical protein
MMSLTTMSFNLFQHFGQTTMTTPRDPILKRSVANTDQFRNFFQGFAQPELPKGVKTSLPFRIAFFAVEFSEF